MKKFFRMMLLPLMLCLPFATITSCSDDDDLPDVNLSIEIDGGKAVGEVIYVVKGETLKITSVNITNNEQGKNALITSATYFLDGFRLGTVILPPFPYDITFEREQSVGDHNLEILCDVAAEGKALGIALISYHVKVVEDASDIPDEGVTSIRTTVPVGKN